MNLVQNTNLCLKLRNVSQPLLHPANEQTGTNSFNLWITALLQVIMITSNLLSLLVIPFLMPRPVFCTISYMGCCLLALCLEKTSLGTFFSWCLILGHLFLFLTHADHLSPWQNLCCSLLCSRCLCFPQIQGKTLKQSSEEGNLCFLNRNALWVLSLCCWFWKPLLHVWEWFVLCHVSPWCRSSAVVQAGLNFHTCSPLTPAPIPVAHWPRSTSPRPGDMWGFDRGLDAS